MCFICKLFFGYVKFFMVYVFLEYLMFFNEKEKDIMLKKNVFVII